MSLKTQVRVGAVITAEARFFDLRRMEKDLRVWNKAVRTKVDLGRKLAKKDVEYVDLLEYRGDEISFPRGIQWREYLRPGTEVEVVREEFNPEPASLDFKRTLREVQQKAADAAIAAGLEKDHLLCLGCGQGKSSWGLWFAAQRGKKTLVVVDRDFIVDQWANETATCFGEEEREKLGRVQGQKWKVGPNITVAMIHTLSQNLDRLTPEWCGQFGTIIFDEVHVLSAPSFSKTISRFKGVRLGLSATPTRVDGMDPIFRSHLSATPVFTYTKSRYNAEWYFKRTPHLVPPQEVERKMMTASWVNGRQVMMLNRPVYDTQACERGVFEEFILRDIRRLVTSGRCALVLGTRTEILERMSNACAAEGISSSFIIGRVKRKEREEGFQAQVIFATASLASKALDIPRLDTLILLFPSADEGFIRQAKGRIDRDYEGKKAPIVVTYVHPVRSLEKKSEQMAAIARTVDRGAKVAWVGGTK